MDKKLLVNICVIILFIGAFFFITQNNKQPIIMNNTIQNSNQDNNVEIVPIEHATVILKWAGKIIYVDPVGGADLFINEPAPDIILLTHDHGDHFNVETLQALAQNETLIIAPMKVADMIPNTILGTLLVAKNGQNTIERGFEIEIIPSYNLSKDEKVYHPKGEGNGYVLGRDGERVYISGDSADTPEMRSLKNIDIAFVAMNLPYTMSVEEAADAVLDFKPKKVYPYHYRTPNGFSDVEKFKSLVTAKDNNIQVVELNWYPK